MALVSSLGEGAPFAAVCVAVIIVLATGIRYLFHKPSLPHSAPPLTTEFYPLLGSLQFFTQRWDFLRRSMARSTTGNFSLYAGQWPVVAIGTDEGRKVFFESKDLDFNKGYSTLLGGTPTADEKNDPLASRSHKDGGFTGYFAKRLHNLLKGNRLKKSLPLLIGDTRGVLDELMAESRAMIDPYESIYKLVFKLTMRTVACNEIADDPVLLARILTLFEGLDGTVTPLSIMFPWMPTPAKFKRLYYGSKLYVLMKRVVDDRKRLNRTEDDALQYLLDEGDSLTMIITFVLGSLFAGQLNTGVNAAWILVYLASKPYWMDRIREEINTVVDRYSKAESAPLKERLMDVPIEAWESEFPIIDMCLKDCIRLQMPGTGFRKNTSGSAIPLNKEGTEVIPDGAYVALGIGTTFYDPNIFEDPDEWDPGRYSADRAEDKKRLYAWWGWGHGRHPCPGMRFAKLEITIIVAFFLAYFDDIQLCDGDREPTSRLPFVDRNRHSATVPTERVYLRYR